MGIQGTLIRMAPNHVFEQRAIRDQFAQCTGILGPNTLSFETIQALAQQFGSFSCGDHRTRLECRQRGLPGFIDAGHGRSAGALGHEPAKRRDRLVSSADTFDPPTESTRQFITSTMQHELDE